MSTIMFIDHYAVLGVSRYASVKEINSAWKQFALKYHPDKCNGNDAVGEFLKGLEAAATLRDPQCREDYDKELRAHELHYQTNRAGGDHRPSQTYSAHASPMNHQSQHSNDPGDWTDSQRSWTYGGNGYHGSPPRYNQAQMDMIFETVKRRERERIAAEREKARQAEAELEKRQTEAELKKRQLETEQEMHAWDTNNRPSNDAGPQKVQTEICEENKIAPNVPDKARVSAAEIIETAESSPLGQNMETPSNGNDQAGPDTTVPHRSTVFRSANASVRGSSDFTWLRSAPDSPADWDDNSTDSDGGVPLTNFETHNKGEGTSSLDRGGLPCTVPDLDPARLSSGPNPPSTEQSTEGTVRAAENPQSQWPLRPFIPYSKAKLDDPSSRYIHEDMCQELSGLIMGAVGTWVESSGLFRFACSHVGSWNKEFGQPECDNCHLGRPLYTLTCQCCGLKRCVRCKREN